jgi:hypothetical protein
MPKPSRHANSHIPATLASRQLEAAMPANVIHTAPPAGDDDSSATQTLAQFMACKCVGALPGRACTYCSGTKWLKRCAKCSGSGLDYVNISGREPRGNICGPCMGRGWTSSMPSDRAAIAALAEAAAKIPANV